MAIRSFHVLRLLARAFDVTALCFVRRKGGAGPPLDLAQRLAALRTLADVEAFPVPQEHSVWRLAWDHVRSVGLSRPHTEFTYDSPAVAARLVHLLRTRRFDLIHVDSLALSRYLPLFDGNPPVICVHHNVESQLLERRARAERSTWRRVYMRHQARLMARAERRWCGRCRLNIVVSDADRMALHHIAPGATYAVIPNGVDLEFFRPTPRREEGHEKGAVFVGETTWFPNRDALQYFCDEILPRMRVGGGDGVPPVRWVGRASEEARRHYRARYGVELTGYVEDVRPYVRAAACYVVPLRVGGGTRLKILDAWAMGKAVVSTSIGCEGLVAEDGRNILIRDDPDGFAQAVRAVLQDERLRRRLGAEGRRTVERHYSWERIGESMLRLYRSLLVAAAVTSAALGCSGPVAAVAASPAWATMAAGQSLQLRAMPEDGKGKTLSSRVIRWSSSDTSVARVDTSGLVTGVAVGAATITATSEGKSGTVAITVGTGGSGAASNPPPPNECATPRAEWVWCDDFEQDRLSKYFEYDDANGHFVRVGGVGVGGSFAMRARWDAGQVSAGSLHLAMGKTPQRYFKSIDAGTALYRELFWRVYVRLQPGWRGGGADKLSRAISFASATWAEAMAAQVWSGTSPGPDQNYLTLDPASGTDTAGQLRTTRYNDWNAMRWLGQVRGATPLYADSSAGRWYCVEAHAKLNDPSQANGVFELWINGTLDAQKAELNWVGGFSAYGINALFLENYWNAGALQPEERYLDNLIVATQRIGC